ncbi:MAG: pyruvate ferredoxin oxidoreductase [Methanocalculus sp. MSAO_Arc1]|uniref:pyruvate ferredoxin oxidoreductase n=1 Tax=Methanocalculus TaxID=71151 RepID=UPI000FF24AAD|nr:MULTISPECIES: pyruvate ferredoxin oxidoreductase [unclassified Methanocalculus]RQD81332.1 MAG: pyruvate ferredoxin oxidoreductase [Methanocalculus sp. MSAO_Arc1]
MLMVATGNKAVAAAVKDAKPSVVAAYPITPQSEVVEKIAEYVVSGEMQARYIPVESEHSAMTACIGASVTGVRTFTATSSHGLLYMHEMLHWAAGARLPIVMANINRSLGPGWNVWAEHTDAYSQRDSGWLQFFVADVQEAYDTTLMAFRIAENTGILLPVMVNLDGFLLSHIIQSLDTVDPGDYLPPMELPHAIDTANPAGYGTLTGPQDHFRFRWEIERAMRNAPAVIREAEDEFFKRFGRKYGPTDEYLCEDADVLILSLGTLGREAEVSVDILRKEGIKAGSMRVRWFRPFPELNFGDRELVVIDRGYSFGFGGVLADSIRSRYHDASIYSVIAGLGGQEVTYDDIAGFVRDRKMGEEFWFGVDA